MAIPDFDEYGLLPQGIFNVTSNDISERYCHNPNRMKIWQQFSYFLSFFLYDFKPKFTPIFLLDGGFTSNKPHTKDIDVLIDISQLDLSNQADTNEYFRMFAWFDRYHNYAELMYAVDFYPHHDSVGNNFKSFFAYIKDAEKNAKNIPKNHTKGMLRLSL